MHKPYAHSCFQFTDDGRWPAAIMPTTIKLFTHATGPNEWKVAAVLENGSRVGSSLDRARGRSGLGKLLCTYLTSRFNSS